MARAQFSDSARDLLTILCLVVIVVARLVGGSMAQIMGDVLGRGVTGNVFRAINSEAGEFVAVKQLQLRAVPAETVRRLSCTRRG